jgi:dihydrofolate reductase
MRRVYLFMMVSLDGYFEGSDHDISWHNAGDPEFNDFGIPQLEATDMMLFGHRTYDLMASYWPTDQAKDDPVVAKHMNDTPKIVFSRTLTEAPWSNTRVGNEDAAGAIRELKQKPGQDIAIFGSNELVVSVLPAKVIDEFRIMINPVAIGQGTPLFHGLERRIDFDLKATRTFENGNVLLTYTQP